jgi:hypothetical protein
MHTNPLGSPSSAREPCAPVDALPPGAGGRFAALMQRSWGARRTVNPGLLVLSMLHEEVRRRLLTAWLDAGSGSSSFFAAEADTLLDFIAAQLPADSPERAVCRLEQFTLRASDGAGAFKPPPPALFSPQRLLRRGRHAGMAVFQEGLSPVLHELFSPAAPWAGSRGVTALLVAPASEPLCRLASTPEQHLWQRLGSAVAAAALLEEGTPRDVIEAMLHIGALEYA